MNESKKADKKRSLGQGLHKKNMFFCSYDRCPLIECPHMVSLLIKVRSKNLPSYILKEKGH